MDNIKHAANQPNACKYILLCINLYIYHFCGNSEHAAGTMKIKLKKTKDLLFTVTLFKNKQTKQLLIIYLWTKQMFLTILQPSSLAMEHGEM